jgi:hypothetical protein
MFRWMMSVDHVSVSLPSRLGSLKRQLDGHGLVLSALRVIILRETSCRNLADLQPSGRMI